MICGIRAEGTKMAAFAVVTVAALATLTACGDVSDNRLSGAGESCRKTADCESGLGCVNLVCQQAGADCSSDDICQNGPCVDQGSPTGGTWADPTSALTWQVTPPTDSYDWQGAKTYCDSLSLGGYSDWRLPTIGELRSLIRGCPATEPGGACNVEEGGCLESSCRGVPCGGCSERDGPGGAGMYWPDEIEGGCCRYWSSSPEEDYDGILWGVNFVGGYLESDTGDAANLVRCVR